MKNAVVLVSILLLTMLPASAEAQSVRRDSVGYAAWRISSDDEARSKYLAVWAEESQDVSGETDLRGTIRILTCSRDSAQSESEKCRVRKEIVFKTGDLTLAEDASTGQLTMRANGDEHEVHWTRQGSLPFLGQWQDACPSGQGYGFGPGAPATASGTVLGRELAESKTEAAEIGYGIIVSSCS